MNPDSLLADGQIHEWVRLGLEMVRNREWARRLDDEAGLEETWQVLRLKRGCRRG